MKVTDVALQARDVSVKEDPVVADNAAEAFGKTCLSMDMTTVALDASVLSAAMCCPNTDKTKQPKRKVSPSTRPELSTKVSGQLFMSDAVSANIGKSPKTLNRAPGCSSEAVPLSRKLAKAEASTITGNNAVIPKVLHYIWLGDLLPRKHLLTILKNKQFTKGFTTCLWTDQSERIKTELDFSSNLEIKDYRELVCDDITSASIVGRELIGYANYASASDVLRLKALEKYGGIYLDVDVQLKSTLEYCLFDMPESELRYLKRESGLISNNIFIAPKENAAVKSLLRVIHQNYTGHINFLRHCPDADEIKNAFDSHYGSGENYQNAMFWYYKRGLPDLPKAHARFFLTIAGSGPYLIFGGFILENLTMEKKREVGFIAPGEVDIPLTRSVFFDPKKLADNTDTKSWGNPVVRGRTTTKRHYEAVPDSYMSECRRSIKLKAISTIEVENLYV